MPTRPAPNRRLQHILDRFPGRRILVIGDVMLDQFLRGKVSRISPEAPVPVVTVTEDTVMPGGAGNVACNLTALGASVSLLSLVGDDAPGRRLLSELRSRGMDTGPVVADPSRPTTQKCRIVAEHQQVVRVDRETVEPVPPAVSRALLAHLASAVRDADGLIVSDYGKGVVTRSVVRRALSLAHRHKVPVLVDPKIEHFKLYRGVDCITPNTNEAWGGMRQTARPGEQAVRDLGARILRTLRLRSLLITRSEKGMTLFQAGKPPRHIPARAREVYDVTGAGDTVISVMALALACKALPFEAAVLANAAAGVVVGKLGTATATRGEIAAALAEEVR
ncbi:MAG: D-glycero-beta-D-manno-heptose-7-phosphate kinase [Elusimicrobia bacterium]|nr:D-glycero-beta-D-manno-heptose-7-phosphate kinase [Elusimicrobiota bacterium]